MTGGLDNKTGAGGRGGLPPLVARLRASPVPRLIWAARSLWMRVARPFRLGVRTMVLDEGGSVLLIRHSYRPGWHFPGGGVKRWETIETAAIRETREEGAIQVDALDTLFGLYANFDIGYCDHVALFTARRWQPVPESSFEIVEARFFALKALPDDASPPTRRRVEEYLGQRPREAHW